MDQQRTLRNAISCVGVGLHSGAGVALTISPAAPDHGLRFRRVDRADAPWIPARIEHAALDGEGTALAGSRGPRVRTVEHLLTALSVCAVDNAAIELSGPEVPSLGDGPGRFIRLLECAGITEQPAAARYFEVRRPMGMTFGVRSARLEVGPAQVASPDPALADLVLLGARLRGRFVGQDDDRAVRHALLRTVLADEEAWRLIDAEGTVLPPPPRPLSAFATAQSAG